MRRLQNFIWNIQKLFWVFYLVEFDNNGEFQEFILHDDSNGVADQHKQV